MVSGEGALKSVGSEAEVICFSLVVCSMLARTVIHRRRMSSSLSMFSSSRSELGA